MKKKSRTYTLTNENGNWLGQIVITEDGMYASVTDYGNLSYAWRSSGDKDFREFLCSLNDEYFGRKMAEGLNYLVFSRKIDKACQRYAEQILPALKKVLQEDLKENPTW